MKVNGRTLIDGGMQWTRSITSPRRRTESTLWASLDDLVVRSAIEREIRDDGQERRAGKLENEFHDLLIPIRIK